MRALSSQVHVQYAPRGAPQLTRRVAVPLPQARDALLGLVGFDWVQYLYRTSVRNREQFAGRQHLFRPVDWVADYGCCVTEQELAAVVIRSPSLMLVHTKLFFDDARLLSKIIER